MKRLIDITAFYFIDLVSRIYSHHILNSVLCVTCYINFALSHKKWYEKIKNIYPFLNNKIMIQKKYSNDPQNNILLYHLTLISIAPGNKKFPIQTKQFSLHSYFIMDLINYWISSLNNFSKKYDRKDQIISMQ